MFKSVRRRGARRRYARLHYALSCLAVAVPAAVVPAVVVPVLVPCHDQCEVEVARDEIAAVGMEDHCSCSPTLVIA